MAKEFFRNIFKVEHPRVNWSITVSRIPNYKILISDFFLRSRSGPSRLANGDWSNIIGSFLLLLKSLNDSFQNSFNFLWHKLKNAFYIFFCVWFRIKTEKTFLLFFFNFETKIFFFHKNFENTFSKEKKWKKYFLNRLEWWWFELNFCRNVETRFGEKVEASN